MNRLRNKTKTLVECALLLAIGTILARIKIYELPNGGAITAFSMLPFIVVSFRHGIKWGVLTGFVNSLLQMILGGLYPPPAGTVISFAGMILLDYVIAFTSLGTACLFSKPFKNHYLGIIVGTVSVGIIRFLCSFLSGIILWASYAPEGMPAIIYSFGYNISYMFPEIMLTTLAILSLYKAYPRIFNNMN